MRAVLVVALAALVLVAPLTGGVADASLPGPFFSNVAGVTAADLSYSYRPGCPVPPSQLRDVGLSYWGFDNRPHFGHLIVNVAVVKNVVRVFRDLYWQRFPIRGMRPIDAYRGNDNRSMAADNTSAFNCRYAVAPGPKRWSVHAYGEAIDVNTVENPYIESGIVRPAAGKRYLDRSHIRPGMAYRHGGLVAAFATVGWSWGGRWTGSPDYQHFSKTGG